VLGCRAFVCCLVGWLAGGCLCASPSCDQSCHSINATEPRISMEGKEGCLREGLGECTMAKEATRVELLLWMYSDAAY
jgi:hypothetical protein